MPIKNQYGQVTFDANQQFAQNKEQLEATLPPDIFNRFNSSTKLATITPPQTFTPPEQAPPVPGPAPPPLYDPGTFSAPAPPGGYEPPPPPPFGEVPDLGDVGIGQGFLTGFGDVLPQLWREIPEGFGGMVKIEDIFNHPFFGQQRYLTAQGQAFLESLSTDPARKLPSKGGYIAIGNLLRRLLQVDGLSSEGIEYALNLLRHGWQFGDPRRPGPDPTPFPFPGPFPIP